MTVYAYGGGGGSAIAGTNAYAGTGAGGYPAAGIGRWRSWSVGSGDHANGGGGYSGGCSQPVLGNGYNGYTADCTPTAFGTGGSYFSYGTSTTNALKSLEAGGTWGAIGGQGAGFGDGWNTQGGDGGIAGSGGTVSVSLTATVYAYNGNRYTDGTDYNNGKNQLEIYAQTGILRDVYKYDIYWDAREYRYVSFFQELFGNSVSSLIQSFSMHTTTRDYDNGHYNYLVREQTTCSTTGYVNPATGSTQGIGSGAGYIELSNGTYTIDSSMN